MSRKPVRVLHIITRLIVGGAQENTIYTALMLDKTKYRIDVLTGPQTGAEGSLIEEFRDRGGNLIILREMIREISPVNDFLAFTKLVRLIKMGHYDIVHTHSSKAGVLGRMAAKLAGVPLIIHTVHGWSFHSHMSRWIAGVYIWLEKFSEKITDKLIVVTTLDVKKGLDVGIGKKDKYKLIRSAINLEAFNPKLYDKKVTRKRLGIPADALVVGNVGRLSIQKNPMEWLRVASLLSEKMGNIYFLMVGDGPLRDEVEETIREFKLEEKVILTGLRRDVPRLMSAMDIFLLTSKWEGLPRVLPQAMSMGIPVVATIADGTAEIIENGKTGFLCETGDINRMAAVCLELLNDSKLRDEIGDNGKKQVRREFDVKLMIKEIDHLYTESLKNKKFID